MYQNVDKIPNFFSFLNLRTIWGLITELWENHMDILGMC